MKYALVAALAAVQAREYLQMGTACQNSGINGVTCGPSDSQLFAEGAEGDADLGIKITMKGTKLNSYNEKLIQLAPEDNQLFAEGAEGDAELGLKIQMKGNRFDTYKQTLVQMRDGDEGYDDPEKVHILDPKIAKSHTTFYNKDNQDKQ